MWEGEEVMGGGGGGRERNGFHLDGRCFFPFRTLKEEVSLALDVEYVCSTRCMVRISLVLLNDLELELENFILQGL